MNEVKSILDVQTLVVTLPPPPVDEVIKKFAGHHSPRTLAAARRIAKKQSTVKIPRNIMRKIYEITGGWTDAKAWDNDVVLKKDDGGYKFIKFGDTVIFLAMGSYQYLYVQYRGRVVARYNGYSYSWKDRKSPLAAFTALGEKFIPA